MLDIRHFDHIDGPVLTLASKAWTYLKDNNLTGGYFPNSVDISASQAFAIFDHDVPVAIMAFQKEADNGYYVNVTWVEPEYRKRGYYPILWIRLFVLAKEQKMEYICSWILPQNTRMREIAKSNGRTEKVIYEDGIEIIESTMTL